LRRIKIKDKILFEACPLANEVCQNWVLEKYVELNQDLARVYAHFCEITEDLERLNCIKDAVGIQMEISRVRNSKMDTDNFGANSTEQTPRVESSKTQTPPMSFSLQYNTLKREREIGAHNWAIFEKLASEPSLRIDQRNINLIPAINNQRRANSSLDSTVKKIVHVKRPVHEIRLVSMVNGVETLCPPKTEDQPEPSLNYVNINAVEEVRKTIG
jgi:hypothetical protein